MISYLLSWYVVFLFSVTVHEASHAYAAMRLGDDTAYQNGQVSINPYPHIRREPFGMVIIPLLSYIAGGWMIGWGSTPYDPSWAIENPKKSGLMSLAGPLANFTILIVSAIIIRAGIILGLFVEPDTIRFNQIVAAAQTGSMAGLALLLSILFSLNLILLIFNLLPLPPLDGSGLPLLFMEREKARNYLSLINNSGFSFIGIIVAWRIFGILYGPLHTMFVNILYSGIAHYR